jgi:hypothetical protein
MKSKKSDVAEFWQELERQLGQPVLEKAFGQYVSGWPGWDVPCWGIFFLTPSSLHFRHFNQENWFGSMLTSAGRRKADEEREFRISRSDIADMSRKPSREGLLRFLFSPDPKAVLTLRPEDAERKLVIRVEQNPESFFRALEKR